MTGLRYVRQWLAKNWPDLVAVSAAVALFIYVHRPLDGLDTGGDAVSKWHFVRQWRYDNDFSLEKWDHHMTRMGVNVPAWLVQQLFGSNWRSYYIAPMFMNAAQLPLAFLLARRFGGWVGGLFACLCIIYLSAVHTAVSQLLPDSFTGAYALLATYLIVRLAEVAPGRRQWPLLLGISLVAFAGYQAKETFFFFYPGMGLALLLARRKLLDGAIFCGVLLCGLALETLLYRAFTTYSSRLDIVRSVHFAGAEDETVDLTVHGLWHPFAKLAPDWQRLCVLALVGCVWLLFFSAPRRRRGQAIALVGLSHVLLFGVSSQMWQRPLPRYMDPAIPFAAIAAGVAIGGAARGLWRLLAWGLARRGHWQRVESLLMRPAVPAAASVGVLLLCAGSTYRERKERPPFDGYDHGAIMARVANNAYERNLPLFQKTRRGKVLGAFYDVYLHDKKLARAGRLPDFGDVRRRYSYFSYIAKSPEVYDDRVFEALLDAGCALEVRRGPRRLGMGGCADLVRRDVLPERCDRILAKVSNAQ